MECCLHEGIWFLLKVRSEHYGQGSTGQIHSWCCVFMTITFSNIISQYLSPSLWDHRCSFLAELFYSHALKMFFFGGGGWRLTISHKIWKTWENRAFWLAERQGYNTNCAISLLVVHIFKSFIDHKQLCIKPIGFLVWFPFIPSPVLLVKNTSLIPKNQLWVWHLLTHWSPAWQPTCPSKITHRQ